MTFHISGKLCSIGVVLAALITAFSLPAPEGLPLANAPIVKLNDPPREVNPAAAVEVGPVANPVYTLRATGYNSHANQTDSTPFITATGATTRFGIIAASRDLLTEDLPYGSLVRIRDLGGYGSGRGAGNFQSLLDSQELFVVEDTMHPRKRGQVDVWFPDFATARSWGVRSVEVEVVRYGRYGPVLDNVLGDFPVMPQLLASR